MTEDDGKESTRDVLKDREGYFGWARKMRLLAMKKGDVQGIFAEDGTKGVYAALPAGAPGAAARKKWSETTRKLIGEIGSTIENGTLQEIWSVEYERIDAQGAGPPDEQPFAVGMCMAALERECARATALGMGNARTQFTLALQSFSEAETGSRGGAHAEASAAPHSGFVAYADRVKAAERKLTAMGVAMSDEEKKQAFFLHFAGNNEHWRVSLHIWRQDDALTFDALLAKGVQQQHSLDLQANNAAASAVKGFTAPANDANDSWCVDTKGGRGNDAYFARKGGKGRGRGGGRYGARGKQAYKVQAKFEGTCYTCGKKGHKAEDCRVGQSRKGGKKGKGKGKGSGGKGGKAGRIRAMDFMSQDSLRWFLLRTSARVTGIASTSCGTRRCFGSWSSA